MCLFTNASEQTESRRAGPASDPSSGPAAPSAEQTLLLQEGRSAERLRVCARLVRSTLPSANVHTVWRSGVRDTPQPLPGGKVGGGTAPSQSRNPGGRGLTSEQSTMFAFQLCLSIRELLTKRLWKVLEHKQHN